MTGEKHGEADHIQREPARGAIHKSGDGRRWRKVRWLGRDAWAKALTDAQYDLRTGKPITDDHLKAMGYELAP